MKTYSDLIKYCRFIDRFNYLKLDGVVGEPIFGDARYLNQMFYQSNTWKRIRDKIIVRDNGCDLGVNGYQINGRIYIHHINPITKDDILNSSFNLIDPNNLISVSFDTHNAITYGDNNLLSLGPIERTKNDTCPWRSHE